MKPTQAPPDTLDDLRIIACGLLADGIDVSKLTNVGKAELRQAINQILKLAAERSALPTDASPDTYDREGWDK